MMSIGTGSSRPASSIPVPGSSHATASSAGAWVIAANIQPATHDHFRYHARAARALRAPSASDPATAPVTT